MIRQPLEIRRVRVSIRLPHPTAVSGYTLSHRLATVLPGQRRSRVGVGVAGELPLISASINFRIDFRQYDRPAISTNMSVNGAIDSYVSLENTEEL